MRDIGEAVYLRYTVLPNLMCGGAANSEENHSCQVEGYRERQCSTLHWRFGDRLTCWGVKMAGT